MRTQVKTPGLAHGFMPDPGAISCYDRSWLCRDPGAALFVAAIAITWPGGCGPMHQAWFSGAEGFVRMFQRHMKRKAKYPDEGPATGMQYKGIENPRPESDAAVHELFS